MFYLLIYGIICLTTILILALNLISLFGRYPYLELTTHFRTQYLVAAIICLIFLLFFASWSFAFVAFILILFNGIYVLPYYLPGKNSTRNISTFPFKIMTANIEYKNTSYDKLLESVKTANPDILILQELTDLWRQNVKGLENNYTYFQTEARKGGSGLAIFSRFPIQDLEVLDLDESGRASIFCKIRLGERLLSLLTIHPSTPMNEIQFLSRNKHFAEAAKIMKAAAEPKLLIGDMNTTMWSPYFSQLAADSGLRDVRIGKGLLTSWVSFFPAPFRIAIDHCLISETIELEDVSIGDFTGSDHLPLIVDLKIEK